MKHNNYNEEMMFLSIDGFEEIESLIPEAKKAPSKKKATKRTGIFGKRMNTKKAVQAAKQKRTHKKRSFFAVAASITAIMLSAATVGAVVTGTFNTPQAAVVKADAPKGGVPEGYETVQNEVPSYEEPVGAVENYDSVSDGYYGYCGLYVDGELIGIVDDYEGLTAALDQVIADAISCYTDPSTTAEFVNDIEIMPLTYGNAADLEDVMANFRSVVSIRLATNWVDELEIPGSDNVLRIVTRITFVNGEVEDETVVDMQETAKTVEETTDEDAPTRYEIVEEEDARPNTGVTEEAPAEEPATEAATEPATEAPTEPEEVEEETVPEETKPASSSTNTSSSSSSGFIWPFPHTHNITSYMEWRWGRMHNGLDIAGGDDYGQPFYAAASGNVIWSGNDGGGYGNYVMIDHGNGYMTVYGHASALACSTGDYVNQGDLIGYVGDTGNATGPHLHFEIRLNDEYMNPLDYVS